MAEQDKGFLGRWSARKVAATEGKPAANAAVIVPQPALVLPTQLAPIEALPELTLDDVAALTPTSDFSTFVAKGVDSAVKNAAMKKLFADPHYNIMDGLDIYIGDYSTHDPLPQSVVDEITKDGFLNMFQKEEVPSESSAESTPTPENIAHDDPDLQLQRDDAPGREGSEPKSSQLAVPPPST